VIYLTTSNADFAVVAFWNISAGIVLGLLAALFGLIDWLAIPRDTRAKSIGLWHGIGNVVIVGLMILSWLLRQGKPAYGSDTLPFLLALLAVALALVTAWLGGEMVYRLGIAVDRDANLDAPSSLESDGILSSGEPPGAATTR
jgi:uncharacterized membrane protein